MKKLKFLPFLLCLIACDDDVTRTRLRINHYQQTATFLSDHFILVSQNKDQFGSDQWTYHQYIEGFDYEWGYTYELVVKKEEREERLQDVSSIKTTLIRVVSKKRVSHDTPFEIRLTRTFDDGGFINYVRGDLSASYTILGSVAIDCGGLCNDLSEGLNAKESLVGVFNHLDEGVKLIELKRE